MQQKLHMHCDLPQDVTIEIRHDKHIKLSGVLYHL